ncbi:Transcription factor lepE-like protein [Cladobotryum mycophilum]|uniref:Transcription factor lepE-like protein n=1 Tax=Cladobotryum mycophilum TaxID=491253 RepID=A0ABR0SYU1_9HYPO
MSTDATNLSDVAGSYDASSSRSQQASPRQQSQHQYPQEPTHSHSHSQQQQQQQQQQQLVPPQIIHRTVKRPRPVKSCTECRKRKLRCDRLCPCSQCQKSGRPCKYAPDQDSANLSDGSDVEAVDSGRPSKRNYPPGITAPAGMLCTDVATTPSLTKNTESPGLPLLEELSLRMERLEKQVLARSPAGTDLSTGRIVAASPETVRGLTVKRGALRTRYFGQNSPRVLMNLFDDAKAYSAENFHREPFLSFELLHKHLRGVYAKCLTPITVFVDSMMPVQKRMTDILPKKAVCDRLVATYIDTSETIYRILHLPSFAEQYNLYWEGKLQSDFFLPQLLSVLSLASRFETKSKGLGHERVEGVHIPTACALVRTWLDGLKGKQLVELHTLQVEVLLLHAQRMITQRAQDSWNQLGYIVRLAMTMGLHRDPAEFEPRISVFLGEIRRRLWFTICDMDLHMSIASNMPCLVREGDYTCRPPRNIDDVEIFPDIVELPPSKPIDQMTDNQVQVYGSMTLPCRMRVSHMINRIDTIRDYQEVLDIGAKLDRYIEDINYIFPRHVQLSDEQRSRMWRSRAVLDMHVRRPLLALYRPFAMGAPDTPIQISRAYLRSSMVILKYLDEIDPSLPHFSDVSEMYLQMLKRDIIQASLSVCYFIKPAIRPGSDSGALAQHGLRLSPVAADDYPSYVPDDIMLWSPSRLITTVQKTLDLLIGGMVGGDLKDIVCLAVVLESVSRPSARQDDITRGLYALLENCLRSAGVTMDKLREVTPGGTDGFRADSYMHGMMPYMQHGYNMGGMSDNTSDFGGWIMWDGWD